MNYPFNSCHVWFVDKYKSKLTQFHSNSQGKHSEVLNPSFTPPMLMGYLWKNVDESYFAVVNGFTQ